MMSLSRIRPRLPLHGHAMAKKRATQSSWRTSPPPSARESLAFEAVFTDSEAELMMLGAIPADMDDKWFVYFHDGWLHFHRSWTGFHIYALRLDGSPGGVRVTDSWVNRDPDQYSSTDTAYDRQLLRFLIDRLLLGKDVNAPFPPQER